MKLIVLRHGETEEEKNGIILGQLPGTLSDQAKDQAKRVAEWIKSASWKPEIILTSDLARSADYSSLIANELGLKVELEPLARERNAGIATGKTEAEIDWEKYEKQEKPLRKHIGGESFEDVRLRAREFLMKLASGPYQVAVLISHSVFLATLAMEICGWPLDQALARDFRKPLILDTKEKRAESLPPSSNLG